MRLDFRAYFGVVLLLVPLAGQHDDGHVNAEDYQDDDHSSVFLKPLTLVGEKTRCLLSHGQEASVAKSYDPQSIQ